jgi:hypothetical protein
MSQRSNFASSIGGCRRQTLSGSSLDGPFVGGFKGTLDQNESSHDLLHFNPLTPNVKKCSYWALIPFVRKLLRKLSFKFSNISDSALL